MLVGYLMWMKLLLSPLPKNHKKCWLVGVEHQAGAMTSAERGTDTTCMFCMGSSGMFVPSMLMFKKLRCKFELSTRLSPGTLFACTENGCITSDFLFSGSNILYKQRSQSKKRKYYFCWMGIQQKKKKRKLSSC